MRLALAAGLLLALAGSAGAETDDELRTIDGSVPMFCRRGSGDYVPFAATTYDRFSEGFTRQFGWQHSLHISSRTLGYLVYSPSGQMDNSESILYDVEPYEGGIAVLHMHVAIGKTKHLISGDPMCWQSFSIVNSK